MKLCRHSWTVIKTYLIVMGAFLAKGRGMRAAKELTAEPRRKYKQTSRYPCQPKAEKITLPNSQECKTPAGVKPAMRF